MAQPLSRTAAKNGRLLAGRQLSVGRPDLSVRQSAAERAAEAGTHQAAAAGPLGHHAGAEFHLRPPEPPDQRTRSEHDLHRRPRARRAGHGGQHLPGRHLQRALPEHLAGRGGHEAAVQAVLVPRRHPQPRRAGNARLDPRRRRTGLLAVARLRRGVRQSRSAGRPASSATARPRPGRWPPVGTRTSSSIRSATARCCRSCT